MPSRFAGAEYAPNLSAGIELREFKFSLPSGVFHHDKVRAHVLEPDDLLPTRPRSDPSRAVEYLAVHTHFIELQPSHTLEQVPFLVLAKQRWNVSEACRLLDDAAHPTHSTNLRSGSVCRSC
jgi:hypothetical protein